MAGASSFFVRDGERYRPTDRSHGPWDEAQLSGSMAAALLAHGVEGRRPQGFHVARLTVDLFRAVPWAPLAGCRPSSCAPGGGSTRSTPGSSTRGAS